MPKLPTDPSLRPALRPARVAVPAEGPAAAEPGQCRCSPTSVVCPSGRARRPVAAGAAAGPTGGGTAGGAAGGMGGMPMGGAGHGQGGGKEKKRTPGLAPDEDLYTEDRPWTEAVIGNRRRKDVQDNKDSK